MRLPSHNHFVLDLRGSTERAFADAIVLWGTGYSSVMNSNLVDALRSNLYGHHVKSSNFFFCLRSFGVLTVGGCHSVL